MISKEEYARLYCDDGLLEHGVYALSQEKVLIRMMHDPYKTLKDLDDYGINDMMGPGGDNIERVDILNTRTGEKTQIGGRDALQRALEAGKDTNPNKPQPTPILDRLIREHREE
jgi:hypothetical protein